VCARVRVYTCGFVCVCVCVCVCEKKNIYIYKFFPANVVFVQILITIMHMYIPVSFLLLAFCHQQKVESQIFFFLCVVFAKILIKIIYVCIIHIYCMYGRY
jgi:hypothetical protein